MKKNQYVVFGLGRFGVALTKALNEYGAEVLVVDKDEELVNEISPYCTHAVCMDATDERNLERLGINNMDVAIVCIASNIEAYSSACCASRWAYPKLYPKRATKNTNSCSNA